MEANNGPKLGEKSDVTDFDQSYVPGPKLIADYKNRFKFGVNLAVFLKFGKNEQKTRNFDKYNVTHMVKIQNFTKIIKKWCIY